MYRLDDSKYLLYIEPSAIDKLKQPVNDKLTVLLEFALEKAKPGGASYSDMENDGNFFAGGWKGCHTTDCGERSTNHDYLLENGMITNSLAPFYARWYRNSIPKCELKKLHELAIFYRSDLACVLTEDANSATRATQYMFDKDDEFTMKGFLEALREVKLHTEGKLQMKSFDEFLKELYECHYYI